MYVPYMAMTARKKTFTLPHSNAHGHRERERPTKEAIRRKKRAVLNVGRMEGCVQVCVLDAGGVAVSGHGGVRVGPGALLGDRDLVRRPRVLREGELGHSLLVGRLQIIVDHTAAHEADGGCRHGLRREKARAGAVCKRVGASGQREARRGAHKRRGA